MVVPKSYELVTKYIDNMSEVTGDTTPILRVGSAIKNLGYAQIVIMVGGFFIGIALASSIIGAATRSGSLEEFLISFKDTLRVFLIAILLLSLVDTFFFYRLFRSLNSVEKDGEFSNPLIDKAAKLFAATIIIQILGLIVGYYFINLILDDLDELIASNPTSEDFETWANNINTRVDIIISSIIAIIVSLLMLTAFNSIKVWLLELHARTGIYWLSEASGKLGTVRAGFMIMIAGQILNLITLSSLGNALGFISAIILIIGYIQVGNRIENIPMNINEGNAGPTYPPQQGYYPPPKQSLANTEVSSNGNYCPGCGHSNMIGSQFCHSCGSKLT